MNPSTMNPLTVNPLLSVVGVVVPSSLELLVRMGVGLGVVTGLLLVGTRVVKRQMGDRLVGRPRVVVEHQQQVSKNTRVVLLTAGERHLLIAVNNQSTTLLAEGADLTTPHTPTPDNNPNPTGAEIDVRTKPKPPTRAWSNPIQTLQNRTVRRA